MSRKLFVTTALPYANGSFHIGHIMSTSSRYLVRFQRMQGNEVHFVCADDAHGAPIMLKAEAEGVTPQQLSGASARAQAVSDGFHIGFDNWHSTDSPRTPSSRRTSTASSSRGLIYAKPVEQFYDPVKACSLPTATSRASARSAAPRPVRRCLRELQLGLFTDRAHQPVFDAVRRRPELKTSEHYFFRLSIPNAWIS